MCCSCGEENGAFTIDNERVRAVQPLIAAVYQHSGAGGNLHIVLDDTNLEDENLAFCAERIAEGGYENDPPEQLAAEHACCIALQAMTFDERVSAVGLWDRCWKTQGATC